MSNVAGMYYRKLATNNFPQELLKYEQDVYLLQSKVKSAGLAGGGGGGGDSDSRSEQLTKQLAELEKLLTGMWASLVIMGWIMEFC